MSFKQYFFIVVMTSLTLAGIQAQTTDVFGNKVPAKKKAVAPIPTHFNSTDANGLKQGKWEKRYTSGAPLYTATFKDDKPIGEYIRFYPNGKKSMRIVYDAEGINGNAELFDEKGDLASSGLYKGKSKEGTWIYYTSKKIIASSEEFVNNKRHGKAVVYYPDGKIAETYIWKDGVKHGEWQKLFQSGAVLLKAEYINDLLEGKYLYYFENGHLEIDANYKNDKEDGKWIFYFEDGKVNYILKYKDGVLLNPEVIEQRKAKEQAEFEKNKNLIKDPEKMQNNPDAYIR